MNNWIDLFYGLVEKTIPSGLDSGPGFELRGAMNRMKGKVRPAIPARSPQPGK